MNARKAAPRGKQRGKPARPRTRKAAASRARRRDAAPSGAYADFMVQAYAMESDARERYMEFAEQMEMHNSPEVAQMFRKLARIEGLHADKILEEMGWKKPPAGAEAWMWRHSEAPESAPSGELHYLMQPHHVLQLALECEQRAASFFNGISRSTAPVEVKRIAREMAADEREHIRLIREWMGKVAKPAADWDQDPDPPHQSE